jgi:hypothetical protein
MFLLTAHAADHELVIAAVDAAHAPITTAIVLFTLEKERHRVNAFDGTWAGDALFPGPDQVLPLGFGGNYEVEVSAPGFAPVRTLVVFDRKHRLTEIALSPIETGAGSTDLATTTWREYGEWAEAEKARAASYSDAMFEVTLKERLDVAQASQAWGAAATPAEIDTARLVCRTVSDDPEVCGR